MPITSSNRHFSFRNRQAKSEIQNGFVQKMIIAVLIGSRVKATLIRINVIWPAIERTIMSVIRFLGNLKGFYLRQLTIIAAQAPIAMFLKRVNSMTLTPSFAMYLNIVPCAVAEMANKFMAKIAKHRLSFTSILPSGTYSPVQGTSWSTFDQISF